MVAAVIRARLLRHAWLVLWAIFICAVGSAGGSEASSHDLVGFSCVEWSSVGPDGGTVLALASHAGTILAGTLAGLYRSADGEDAWVHVAAGLPPGTAVAALCFTGAGFYAGTYSGIYRSLDDGRTWEAVGRPGEVIVFLAAIEVSKRVVLLAGVPGGGLYRSIDGGATWTPVLGSRVFAACAVDSRIFIGTDAGVLGSNDLGVTWAPTGLTGFVATALSSLDQTLIAGTDSGVYRSRDGGHSWNASGDGLPQNTMVMALLLHGDALYAGTYGSGTYESTDGGASWSARNTGLAHDRVLGLAATSKHIFAGTQSGSYRSVDKGVTWSTFRKGMRTRAINTLVAKGRSLVAGTESGIARSVDGGGTWIERPAGLPSGVAVNVVLATARGVLAGSDGNGVYRSVDDGGTWTRISKGLPAIAVIRALAQNSDALFAGTSAIMAGSQPLGGGVYRSLDGGSRWTAANNGLPDYSYVTAITAAGRSVFVATLDGIYRSDDDGETWSESAAGLAVARVVLSLASAGGAAFAGSDNGIYVWNGSRWTRSSAGLAGRAALYVNSIRSDAGRLYAGTDNGVYSTALDRIEWTPVCRGLDGLSVLSTVLLRGNLFAGTWGRSVWRVHRRGIVPGQSPSTGEGRRP